MIHLGVSCNSFEGPGIMLISSMQSFSIMDFCPRCGRYLKDDEFQCPECGNIVRELPIRDQVAPEINMMYLGNKAGTFGIRNVFKDRYFYILFAVGFAATFAVTYFWRFSVFFFLVPLLMPAGRFSITLGLVLGMIAGSVLGYLVKTYLTVSLIV